MTGFIKHRVASGVITGLALLIGLAPAASAATISDSDRYAAVDKAAAYLINHQAADGSLTSGVDDTGEWAAIALASAGRQFNQVTDGGDSLLQYFINTKNIDLTPDGSAYHLEQRMLALHAGGYDTASFEGVNYDDLLAGQYATGKISTSDTTYDDIFGIMAIVAADSPTLTAYLQSATDSLAGYQKPDGGYCSTVSCSWGEDVDSTAMAYAALAVARDKGVTTVNGTTPIDTIMSAAHQYIFASETNNLFGSFGPNYSTTSIVAMALNTAGENTQAIATTIMAGQDTSGGIRYDSDPTDPYGGPSVYNTDFAILALLGTNWLLNPAPIARPVVPAQSSGETTKPVVQPAVVAVAHPIISYFATGPAAPAPYTQPVTADTHAPAQSTGTPANSDNQAQPKANQNSTLKYIGYGLIAIAVLGLGFYMAASRQKDK